MVVNFEFLGGEPIENNITCMNFKVDKVVFFGYNEVIAEQKERTVKFLKKYCEVQSVVFNQLARADLQSVLNSMRAVVKREIDKGNQIYFDVTGGESLLLVAFGMLSKEFDTPMHMYDIAGDRLVELNDGSKHSISREVPKRKIPMSLKLLVKMHGGKINRNMHKNSKVVDDEDTVDDVEKIYYTAKANWD
ncbi:MAG: hypothetical protein MJ171_06250, partial [Clostridia bacterium]|nr:hypothetical protein [Clostridia bacterium]